LKDAGWGSAGESLRLVPTELYTAPATMGRYRPPSGRHRPNPLRSSLAVPAPASPNNRSLCGLGNRMGALFPSTSRAWCPKLLRPRTVPSCPGVGLELCHHTAPSSFGAGPELRPHAPPSSFVLVHCPQALPMRSTPSTDGPERWPELCPRALLSSVAPERRSRSGDDCHPRACVPTCHGKIC
jgi:hypothetical protein